MGKASLTEVFDDLHTSGVFSQAQYDAVCDVVRWQMRLRGVWRRSPEMLGYPFSSWEEKGALDAIAVDALDNAVFARMGSLAERRAQGLSVDGLIINNLRWFLDDRQRAVDPEGRNVYACVLAVVEVGVAEGWLVVIDGPSKIGIATIVASTPDDSDELTVDTVRSALVSAPSFSEFVQALDTDGKLEGKRLDSAVAAFAASFRVFIGASRGRTSLKTLVTAAKLEVRAVSGGVSPIPEQEHHSDTPHADWGQQLVEIQSDFNALEDAVRASVEHDETTDVRLAVLRSLTDPRFFDVSDAERARSLGLPRQRYSEHRQEIRRMARGILGSFGQNRLLRR